MKPVIMAGSEEKGVKDSFEYNIEENGWQKKQKCQSIKVVNQNTSECKGEVKEGEQNISDVQEVKKGKDISEQKIEQDYSIDQEEVKHIKEGKYQVSEKILLNNNQEETENKIESEREADGENNQIDGNYSGNKYESEEIIKEQSIKSIKNSIKNNSNHSQEDIKASATNLLRKEDHQ